MSLKSVQMANLLADLDNLSVHRLLVRSHSIKIRGQLVKGFPKSFISLHLSCYEALHKALQVRFGFRRWVVRSSILLPRQLHRTLRMRVRVIVERIYVTRPALIISSGVEDIL